jgi:hypothetical protein
MAMLMDMALSFTRNGTSLAGTIAMGLPYFNMVKLGAAPATCCLG